jgi:hypothetical protein
MAIFNEYPDYDALGLAELVRRRELSASELADTALNAIETFNPSLNAVVRILAESARAAAALAAHRRDKDRHRPQRHRRSPACRSDPRAFRMSFSLDEARLLM